MSEYVYHTDEHGIIHHTKVVEWKPSTHTSKQHTEERWTADELTMIEQQRQRLLTAAWDAKEEQDDWHTVECGNRACVSTCLTRSRWVDEATQAVKAHQLRYPEVN
jgi:hypothetical protein